MKDSQVFTAEYTQRDIKYLQSRDRGTVHWDHKDSNDQKKCIKNLILTANVDQKHRNELWTILNKTSQGHLAEHLCGFECKLVCNM